MRLEKMFLLILLVTGSVYADAAFTFKSTSKHKVKIKIVDKSRAPIQGVRVEIGALIKRTSNKFLAKHSGNYQLYFTGVSDTDGFVTGTAIIPNRVKSVSLSFVKPGYHGRYRKKLRRLKRKWGPFAPALYSQFKVKKSKRLIQRKVRLKARR